ncbi:MAG: hypothetical protein JXA20_10645 [Spirochaetes bacterium]|nr:hypothetical protein [Spirochaetota bacterium]
MKQGIMILLLGACLLGVPAVARDFHNDFMVSVYGGGGIAWPGGAFNRDYDPEARVDGAAAAGVYGAWAPFSFGAVTVSVEYGYRRLSLETVYNGLEYVDTLIAHSFYFSAGWRGFVSVLYYEAGFICGVPFADWEHRTYYDGEEVPSYLGPEGEVLKESRHVDYGAYFGLGVIFWLTEHLAVEGGAQVQVSFAECYRNEDNLNENTLKARALIFRVGAVWCF